MLQSFRQIAVDGSAFDTRVRVRSIVELGLGSVRAAQCSAVPQGRAGAF